MTSDDNSIIDRLTASIPHERTRENYFVLNRSGLDQRDALLDSNGMCK